MASTPCPDDPTLLPAALGGEGAVAIEAHLGSCPVCRRRVKLLRDEVAAFRDAPSASTAGALAAELETGMTLEATAQTLPAPLRDVFRRVRLLGVGAFGEVWLAHDLRLDRPVALKTLKIPPDSTRGPQALAALERDARFLAKVEHPNIVRVHGWHTAGDQHYLALQFVDGGSFASRLKHEKRIDWPDAVQYIADVGEALLAAHAHGIVHRDIKPANILWDAARKEPMLTDFGVSSHLSEPGSIAGTPFYMAPEAWDGHVSPKLDVFSLAATLYHLNTGVLPFPESDRERRLALIRRGLPVPDSRLQALPEPLEQALRNGLASDPDDRPSLCEFIESLRGELNRSLADALVAPLEATSAPVKLRISVSREVGPGTYKIVPTTPPRRLFLSRGMKKGLGPSGEVRLRTGERTRIEVIADQGGYLTVFNVGPDGEMNPLFPDDSSLPAPVEAEQPLRIDDVTMTPPEGRERLFAVWTRRPSPFRLDDLNRLADGEAASASGAYHSTRGMKRVRQSLQELSTGDYHAIVLELDHIP